MFLYRLESKWMQSSNEVADSDSSFVGSSKRRGVRKDEGTKCVLRSKPQSIMELE